jgi:phosphopantetheinyl transferase (holo-ACP synthase)
MGPTDLLVKKDTFGKPFFVHFEEELSISHSWNMAAIMVGHVPNGIDIQYEVPSIKNISKKFVNESEMTFSDYDSLINLHFIWGAKECMYKAYGRKSVDFKKHMTLSGLPNGPVAQVTGMFNKERQEYFDVYYERILGYHLCYAELRPRTD